MSYLEELLPEFRKGAKIRCSNWEKDKRKPEQSKTLLQLVSEGYHLHIRGHWGDGQIIPGTPSKCRTWWNDPDNFTLIDLMTLNKFLLTNQK